MRVYELGGGNIKQPHCITLVQANLGNRETQPKLNYGKERLEIQTVDALHNQNE